MARSGLMRAAGAELWSVKGPLPDLDSLKGPFTDLGKRDQLLKNSRTPSITRSTSASVSDGNNGSESSCS